MTQPLSLTVLISGTGSNLQALIDAIGNDLNDVEIIHVISNVPDAPGLEKAHAAGIETSVLDHREFADRDEFDRSLAVLMASGDPGLVLLAGFMRIIGPNVLEPFAGRMINLHPSLLPLYSGTDTYQRALEAGDRKHGASMHFVTEELDGGPVLSQVVIPVLPGDNPESLAARLSPNEHRLVVATVDFIAHNAVECRNREIRINGETLDRPLRLQDNGTLTR